MPALALLPAELEAIVLGAQWVAAHGDKTLSHAALDVLAKVAAVVPAPLQPLISTPSTAAKLPLDASQDMADRANQPSVQYGRSFSAIRTSRAC